MTLTTHWDRLTPEQRVAAAGVDCMGSPMFSFLTGFYVMGTVSFDDKWQTAATNGRDECYAPSFVAKQNRKQMRYLRTHEVMHKALKHCSDYKEINSKYPLLSNIAQDHVINLMIESLDPTFSFVERPAGVSICCDAQYTDMSWLDVLRLLIKDQPPPDRPNPKKDGSGGKASAPQDGAQPKQGAGEPHDGVGEPGMPLDTHLPLPDDVDADKHNEQVDVMVRQGKFIADKLAGRKGSGGPLDALAQTRSTDWASAMREFIDTVCEGDEYSTFSPPNKRLQHLNNIVLPSRFDERAGELIINCDTSGSMGSVYPTVFGEIARIVQVANPEAVRVIWWDTRVAGEQLFTPAQYANIAKLFKPKGGGGTSPGAVVEYVRAKKYKPVAAIWLTDGYLDGSERQARGLDIPQLWGVVDNTSFRAPVGKVVRINSMTL
jgi:predicted metal-dependent peptidase